MRLFFALWPQEEVRTALKTAGWRVAKACGGKPTRAENLHLTLVFLGEVEPARLPEVRAAADAVSARAFELDLRELGYWPRQRIAWLAPTEPPRGLFDLVSALASGLGARGFALDDRPYLPHVTLLRQARCRGDLPKVDDIVWPVREFVLVSSRLGNEGASYAQLAAWSLPG
ncbi:RNA 2',3'-cyclic phosphodiesterase [Thiobacter aerophilum]|uniref:RNA 2',3'-cyclic phosphodiesterase n=1 Tax=Thiobacter aerophilum TaxID=3121275 RepID=A0ABV0EB70_9BURK